LLSPEFIYHPHHISKHYGISIAKFTTKYSHRSRIMDELDGKQKVLAGRKMAEVIIEEKTRNTKLPGPMDFTGTW
jgi:hypothetical protein